MMREMVAESVAGEVVRRRRREREGNGVMAMAMEGRGVMGEEEEEEEESSDGEMSTPLLVALNCLEDCAREREALRGIAEFRHVGLADLAEGKVEAAAAVVVRSLAHLPGAAQRRLKPWQVILCLSSADKTVDTVLAFELGLQLVHVDKRRVEEVADSTMALMLGLLRRTHVLAKKSYAATDRWFGNVHSVCKGMRRCRGLVLGIVGASATACAVAVRSLAFRMLVVYFDPEENGAGAKRRLPAAARKVDSLTELLVTSDIVSLHCRITRETVQLINGDALRSMKSGAIVINTSSSHLIDDCELKQAIISGTVAGCALDGVEGHHWIESWVKEMPNVIITPRSADYSEDVWLEIRGKTVELLRSFVLDNIIPTDVTSDDDEDDDYYNSFAEEQEHQTPWAGTFTEEIRTQHDGLGGNTSGTNSESRQKQIIFESQSSGLLDQTTEVDSSEVRGSGKRSRRRSGRRKAQQNSQSRGDPVTPVSAVVEWERRPASHLPFASPDQGDAKLKTVGDEPNGRCQPGMGLAIDQLKEGYVVALNALSGGGLYVARQMGPGRGWCLDIMSNVTIQDPAAQFLLIVRNRDRIGLRSFAAGGKLLQANKKLELVFVNHTFDVWEGWFVEGRSIQNCNLTNTRFRSVNLHVSMRVLAAVGEEDGIARWIS